MDWSGLTDFLLRVLAVLLCVSFHELCHGLAAYALGDPTAKKEQRLSLNPLRHIDPAGLLMMVIVGFGWAKPVPVDPRYFRHPKRGMALTALAGPVSNFLLAYAAAMALWITAGIMDTAGYSAALYRTADFCGTVLTLSIGLGIFNLIPFPPLDGSKVVEVLLPDRLWIFIMRYERFGMLALIGLLWLGVLDAPLFAARSWACDLLLSGSEFLYPLITGG